ncbi:helix-turn-helix domain-containing protein [Ideonella sp.]|uniref:helix-turn-helix domain-containing protein n=1 Tax=Ideonella sp. TaxID=1929293 RepID=UPI003BB4FEF1
MLIQKMRLKRGWSQQHLAEASGLSARTIQRLEAGAVPSLETLKALAAVFDVDVQTLQSEDPTMNPATATPSTNPSTTDMIALQQEREALDHVRMIRSFYLHAFQYLVINAAFLIGNYLLDPNHMVAWLVAVCWGIGLAGHAMKVWVLGGTWERAQVERRLGRPL